MMWGELYGSGQPGGVPGTGLSESRPGRLRVARLHWLGGVVAATSRLSRPSGSLQMGERQIGVRPRLRGKTVALSRAARRHARLPLPLSTRTLRVALLIVYPPGRLHLPEVHRLEFRLAIASKEVDAQAVRPGWVDPLRNARAAVGVHFHDGSVEEDV
jgi:hypothetical protein